LAPAPRRADLPGVPADGAGGAGLRVPAVPQGPRRGVWLHLHAGRLFFRGQIFPGQRKFPGSRRQVPGDGLCPDACGRRTPAAGCPKCLRGHALGRRGDAGRWGPRSACLRRAAPRGACLGRTCGEEVLRKISEKSQKRLDIAYVAGYDLPATWAVTASGLVPGAAAGVVFSGFVVRRRAHARRQGHTDGGGASCSARSANRMTTAW